MSNVVNLPTATNSMYTAEGTYARIDSAEVDRLISGLLTERDLDFTRRLQHRVGTKNTRHCIVYTIQSLTTDLGGTQAAPQIYVFNSYRKESAFLIAVGFLRFVCDNGMVVGENLFSQRIIHRAGQTAEQRVAGIENGIAAALDYIQSGALEELTNELVNLPLTDEQAISIAASLPIPKRVRERVMYAFSGLLTRRNEDRGGNLWTFWNVVNEFMRVNARSPVRNLERNTDLLDHVLALYEHELSLIDSPVEVVA